MKRRHVNPLEGYTFSPIPNWLLRRRGISPQAKLLYGRLRQYAGKKAIAFPGLSTLAEELGTSKSSIIRHIRELEKHKLIARERKGLGKTNRYHLLAHEWMREGSSYDNPRVPKSGTSGVPKNDNLDDSTMATPIEREKAKRAGGRDSPPKSSPSSEGGGLEDMGSAHEEARSARAEPEAEKVVPISPEARIHNQYIQHLKQYLREREEVDAWLHTHCKARILPMLKEANNLLGKLIESDLDPGGEIMSAAAKAMALLLDRGSPSATQKAVRRWHSLIVKVYSSAVGDGHEEYNDQAEEA